MGVLIVVVGVPIDAIAGDIGFWIGGPLQTQADITDLCGDILRRRERQPGQRRGRESGQVDSSQAGVVQVVADLWQIGDTRQERRSDFCPQIISGGDDVGGRIVVDQ